MTSNEAPDTNPRALAMYVAARVLPGLASMGLTFLCIHGLSAETYGRYSLTLLPATLAAGLIGGVTGQAMLRHAHELSARGLRRGLVILPLAAAASVAPLLLGYLIWSVGLDAATLAAVALTPLVALMDTRRSLFVAQARARSVLVMDVVRAFGALALAAALLRWAGSSALLPLLAQGFAIAACLAIVRPAAPDAAPHGTREVDARYVRYGLWFAGWIAALGAMSLAERSVVEAVWGLAASGRYAAQADVVNAVFAAVAGGLASSMMPRYLALARAEEPAALHRLLRVGLAGSVAAAGLCLLLGVLLHGFGSGRLAASLIGDPGNALLLVGAGMVWSAAGFLQKPLELRGRTRTVCAAAVVALLLFLAAAPVMARWLGPAGVGLTKALAGVAFVLMTAVATGRTRGGSGGAGMGAT